MKILKKIKNSIRKGLFNYKSFLIGFVTMVVFLLIAPCVLSGFIHNEFDFNQHYIEELDKKYGSSNFNERLNSLVSSYFFKVNNLFNKKILFLVDFRGFSFATYNIESILDD